MQHQDPTRHWTSELGIPKVKQGTEKRKNSLETMKSVLLYYNYIHPIICQWMLMNFSKDAGENIESTDM